MRCRCLKRCLTSAEPRRSMTFRLQSKSAHASLSIAVCFARGARSATRLEAFLSLVRGTTELRTESQSPTPQSCTARPDVSRYVSRSSNARKRAISFANPLLGSILSISTESSGVTDSTIMTSFPSPAFFPSWSRGVAVVDLIRRWSPCPRLIHPHYSVRILFILGVALGV